MLSVKLFARARDLAGASIIELPWNDGANVGVLKQMLSESHPALKPLMPQLLVAVNNDYVRDDAALKTSDEVACFPPVSGG